MRRAALVLALWLAACGAPDAERPGDVVAGTTPLLPDTQTVGGVLVMRHGADAFARAPQWTLDSVPEVVIDGGAEFDLTYVHTVSPLADGRFVVLKNIGGSTLALFGANGQPTKVLARRGQGPGELINASEPTVLPGDTVLVVDGPNRSINRYLPDAGLVRTDRLESPSSHTCFRGSGRLRDGRLALLGVCNTNQRSADGTERDVTPLLVVAPDYTEGDTIAFVPGYSTAPMEIRQGSMHFEVPMPLRFGQHTTVAGVDSLVVVASGVGGYVLDMFLPTGERVGRVAIAVPPQPVTEAMTHAVIDRELAELAARTGGERSALTPDEQRRQIIEAPTADTLPPYSRTHAGADGVFWVLDYSLPDDTTWTATAFRLDGTMLGRLTGRPHREGGASGPIRFERDRVIVREVDGDGVVRFGVYRVDTRK